MLEFLLFEPVFERVAAPYLKNLEQLGIDARMRMVDAAQYQQRLKNFDFDITTERYTMRNTPGVELRSYFGSAAATMDGSLNLAGIADPAVDALIQKIIFAKDRDDQLAATSALDRVLLNGYYVIPSYTLRKERVAHWDRFSHPDTMPAYSIGFPDIWWYDDAKAAKTGKAQ
jgi:microcin C transport system substrate-binding protein